MSDLWSYFKNLFKTVEESSPTQPVIHEMINRNEEELINYEKWKDSLSARRLLDWLQQQHVEYLINPKNVDRSMVFLNTASSKGFALYFEKKLASKQDYFFLFDYLKEKMLSLQYISYVSDTRTYNRSNWVESIHRHYVKPSIRLKSKEEGKVRQAYGNVNIELVLRDDKVHQLKFNATSYNDRIYETASPFSDLMQTLLKRV